MNMWCTGLLCFLLNPFTYWIINKSENILDLIPSNQAKHTNGQSIVSSGTTRPINNKCIVYQPNALKAMCDRLQQDQQLRIMPFGTLDRIRKLQLNNKPTKSKLHLRHHIHQYKINANNLIRIKNNGYKVDSSIIFATCNIQSLHYKELQVSQLISDYSLDLVLRKSKWDSARTCLAKLHWLPIRQRISFKICVLTYKLLHQQGPQYLQEMLQYNAHKRDLRSSSDNSLLIIPRTKCKTFTARAFSVSAPTLWNTLPKSLRELPTLLRFKIDLKTHLYQEAFE